MLAICDSLVDEEVRHILIKNICIKSVPSSTNVRTNVLSNLVWSSYFLGIQLVQHSAGSIKDIQSGPEMGESNWGDSKEIDGNNGPESRESGPKDTQAVISAGDDGKDGQMAVDGPESRERLLAAW